MRLIFPFFHPREKGRLKKYSLLKRKFSYGHKLVIGILGC